MKNTTSLYSGYRYSPEIISHAVWLYHRFCVSIRDVEDLLAKRGVTVSYESIRNWCRNFGSTYAQSIKKRRGRLGDSWYLDEVNIVTVRGERRAPSRVRGVPPWPRWSRGNNPEVPGDATQ